MNTEFVQITHTHTHKLIYGLLEVQKFKYLTISNKFSKTSNLKKKYCYVNTIITPSI